MSRRRPILLIIAMSVGSVAFSAMTHFPVRLFYNPSESAPRGWYLRVPAAGFVPGELAFVSLPTSVAAFAATRRYLPLGVPILKRIEATEGQEVCSCHGSIYVDGRIVALARTRDGKGRPLVIWKGCRALARGELFLLGVESEASFDSRYFGPVQRSLVLGGAVPIWTW